VQYANKSLVTSRKKPGSDDPTKKPPAARKSPTPNPSLLDRDIETARGQTAQPVIQNADCRIWIHKLLRRAIQRPGHTPCLAARLTFFSLLAMCPNQRRSDARGHAYSIHHKFLAPRENRYRLLVLRLSRIEPRGRLTCAVRSFNFRPLSAPPKAK